MEKVTISRKNETVKFWNVHKQQWEIRHFEGFSDLSAKEAHEILAPMADKDRARIKRALEAAGYNSYGHGE